MSVLHSCVMGSGHNVRVCASEKRVQHQQSAAISPCTASRENGHCGTATLLHCSYVVWQGLLSEPLFSVIGLGDRCNHVAIDVLDIGRASSLYHHRR